MAGFDPNQPRNKDGEWAGTSTMIRWMGTAKGGEPVFSLEDRKVNSATTCRF